MRSSSLPTVSPCPAGTCPRATAQLSSAARRVVHQNRRSDQAAVLAEHGYGVLLYDARGHGRGGGTAMDFGWYGDLDIAAALSYLESRRRSTRPDSVPSACRWAASRWSALRRPTPGSARSSAKGSPVAASPTRLALRHWRGWVQRGIDATLYGTADLLTDASPPISLRDAVAAAAPTPVLLIAGGATMGSAEEDADRWIQAGSPSTVDLWVVPDTGHTAALRTQPEEWRATVLGFLDNELLQ